MVLIVHLNCFKYLISAVTKPKEKLQKCKIIWVTAKMVDNRFQKYEYNVTFIFYGTRLKRMGIYKLICNFYYTMLRVKWSYWKSISQLIRKLNTSCYIFVPALPIHL